MKMHPPLAPLLAILALASLFLLACRHQVDDAPASDAAGFDAGGIDAGSEEPDASPTTDAGHDAPLLLDAAPSTVVEIECDGAETAVTVTAPAFGYAFTPDDGAPANEYEIAINSVVRFAMPSSHNVVSGLPGDPDGLFLTNFGETRCFQFSESGSYPFHCGPHQFSATLVVQ